MDIILIPGLWLDGSSWERVVPVLERAGHRAHPLTLPGMGSPDGDRSGITLRDHGDAVIAAIDAVDPAGGAVVLVGHSAGTALAHAANRRASRTDGSPAGCTGTTGSPHGTVVLDHSRRVASIHRQIDDGGQMAAEGLVQLAARFGGDGIDDNGRCARPGYAGEVGDRALRDAQRHVLQVVFARRI